MALTNCMKISAESIVVTRSEHHNQRGGFRSHAKDRWIVAAGPVSRILSAVSGRTVIPLGHALLRGSSDLPGGCGAPSRRAYLADPKARQEIPPYLVLLRVGFALPAASLRRRCALTAPFHPYLSPAAPAVYFLWHFPSNDPARKSAG